MSETATVASGSTPAAAPVTAQAPANAGGKSQAQTPQAGGQAPAPGDGGATAAEQRKLLAETDLDSYIEHTVNGKKEQIKVRDALKGYGLDKAASERMRQAARQEQRFNEMMGLLRTDFDKFCQVTGMDGKAFLRSNVERQREIAEEVLARQYELAQMDPAQRKNLELEQQLKTLREREMSEKKPLIDQIKGLVQEDRLPPGIEQASREELQAFLAARQQEFNSGLDNLSNELLGAWQEVGLPRQKDFGQWMAQVMLDHDRRAEETRKKTGEIIPPLQPKEAALKVKQRFLDSTRSLFDQMDAAAIQTVLGDAIIQKLREHDVKLASQHSGPSFGQNRPGELSPASEPKKYLNQLEWRRQMGIAT